MIGGDSPAEPDVFSDVSSNKSRGTGGLWNMRKTPMAMRKSDSLGDLFAGGMGVSSEYRTIGKS